MTVTQILKGLDKDIQSELKPLFSVQKHFKHYLETKTPTETYKAILLRKAWQLQDQRNSQLTEKQ